MEDDSGGGREQQMMELAVVIAVVKAVVLRAVVLRARQRPWRIIESPLLATTLQALDANKTTLNVMFTGLN